VKPAEHYRGREQTYLKHFFLERYLERVAYKVGSFAPEFVYVDGFSGPWKTEDRIGGVERRYKMARATDAMNASAICRSLGALGRDDVKSSIP
jgi:hypothetical protein